MSVGTVLVTHGDIGAAICREAEHILGEALPSIAVIRIDDSQDYEQQIATLQHTVDQQDQGQGVLILTDLCGATPNNLAAKLVLQGRIALVCGLNLPMLIRVLNYQEQSLDELTQTAVSGGTKGIQEYQP